MERHELVKYTVKYFRVKRNIMLYIHVQDNNV